MMVCSECRERAEWDYTPGFGWVHASDGERLCPVIGEQGYESAQAEKVR